MANPKLNQCTTLLTIFKHLGLRASVGNVLAGCAAPRIRKDFDPLGRDRLATDFTYLGELPVAVVVLGRTLQQPSLAATVAGHARAVNSK